MNADERRSSERAAGWCRPSGATASAVCGICGSNSCRSLSEHGRAEWRFARSTGTGGFPRRPWCGPTGASGRLGGWLRRVGAGCRGRGCFSRNCATTLAPAGQAPLVGFGTGEGTTRRKDRHRSRRIWICEIAQRPSRRARYGRGHDPGKDGHRSRRTWFLRNCATTLASAGVGSSRRVRPGPGHDPGKDRHRSRRTHFFAKLRNNPPSGRTGTGHGGRGFCEIAQRPSRRGQAPPAGFDPGGGHDPGRTGTGRGGRGFCEIVQQPRPPPRAGSSRRVRPGRGARPGKDGHRSLRPCFFCEMRNDPPSGRTGTGLDRRGFCEIAQQPSRRGRLLPPGSARTGFREMRNDPRVKRPRACPRVRCGRVCPWVRCPEGVRDATVRHWPGGGNERVGSLGQLTLTRVATRPGLGPLFAA